MNALPDVMEFKRYCDTYPSIRPNTKNEFVYWEADICDKPMEFCVEGVWNILGVDAASCKEFKLEFSDRKAEGFTSFCLDGYRVWIKNRATGRSTALDTDSSEALIEEYGYGEDEMVFWARVVEEVAL